MKAELLDLQACAFFRHSCIHIYASVAEKAKSLLERNALVEESVKTSEQRGGVLENGI